MLRVRSLGTVPYHEAAELQHALARGEGDDYLLVLQHPHVYTLGAHADPTHVLVDPASVGAALEHTDRGGDVTYHGPGQLVAYPILSVPDDPSAGPAHVHRLEEIVIAVLSDIGLPGAGRVEGYPGVWLGVEDGPARKIAAIGVRTIRGPGNRRRTLHGVALNVDCDLAMFGHIVPCGIADRAVTSVRAEGNIASMAEQVSEEFIARAAAAFGHEAIDRRGTQNAPGVADAGPARERPLLRRLRQAGEEPEAALPLAQRKPPWLRIPVRMGQEYTALGRTIHDLGLVTVCEEAGCPNIYECWSDGTATFMINGERCTRACGFCLVDTRRPLPLAADEPERVAEAVARMRLAHAVITCVARDDLPDGGAGAMAQTIGAIRARTPETQVEVLISDCRGDADDLDTIFAARPDVLNHNIETVARLQQAVRPSAGLRPQLGCAGPGGGGRVCSPSRA